MAAPRLVSHTGTVVSVVDDEVAVLIQATSACASCQGKSFCSMSEKKDKTITVRVRHGRFEPGQQVRVNMRLSLGMKAVGLAYALPLCLLLIILLTLLGLGVSELWSALSSLLVIAVYYILLYTYRDSLKQEYAFDIEKI